MHDACLDSLDSLDSLEPAKLWVIMEHKKAVAEKIKKGGGAAMRKDPHSGCRKKLKALLAEKKAR